MEIPCIHLLLLFPFSFDDVIGPLLKIYADEFYPATRHMKNGTMRSGSNSLTLTGIETLSNAVNLVREEWFLAVAVLVRGK